MVRVGGLWIGQLGLRLALAFVGVAFAAVASVILLGLVTTSGDINELSKGEQLDLTHATAIGVAAAYDRAGWSRENLVPLADLVVSAGARSEEHTSELQSRSDLVCRLLLEKKKKKIKKKKKKKKEKKKKK